MTRRKEPAVEARSRLTRKRVLRSAIGLADTEGIERLTMRRLGEVLGVEAMSLYNHVASKEDLISGMLDVLFADIELSPHNEHWKAALRKRSESVHDVLQSHPWANGLMDSGVSPGPAILRHQDRVLGTFRHGGFSPGLTAHAFSALDSYIHGFARQENALPLEEEDRATVRARALLARLSAAEYPYLHELTALHVLQPLYSYADDLEFGLDLVLDALERARDAEVGHGISAGHPRVPGMDPSTTAASTSDQNEGADRTSGS
ncbi:TetR/AcrR family transcriptional regulator C-terminal domain-containing protein [Arthrobacter sp. CAN_C5]|uniref:TetR/AcrR family transcriptional regulator C-terminal domain-containing protein n=1 Tax=Arthrobacter sp. CAN_C5 TaxID=2760706 RepID=UPI001AE49C43|nr:TetR/AcrR family transcriptional regulator C-terminal domain-containing protein [Arthrobacter sp. CAN_C5]MBP2215094.1 AcrR family transcriptional regulator [Arthrobacter sp. CAN_C5]